MINPLRHLVWFFAATAGILVTGTLAIALPVAASSGCSEIVQAEPPTCLEEAVPGLWAQTGQALALAIGCWLVASFVIPVLIASAIKNESYLLGIIIALSISCGLGYELGQNWVSHRFPEQFLAESSAAYTPVLGIFWTLFFTTPIISGMTRGITLEDLNRERG